MFLSVFFHDATYESGNTQNMTIACDREFGLGDKFEGDSFAKIKEALSEVDDYESFENDEHDLYLFEVKLVYVGADQLARVLNKLYEIVGTELEIDPVLHEDFKIRGDL